MEQFCLIHLSDLHIYDQEDLDHEQVRTNLIKDILKKKDEHKLAIDAIAITGDIIDRGSIESFNKALAFSNEITKGLDISSDKIFCVPGNHDVTRPKILNDFFKDFPYEDYKSEKIFSQHWDILWSRFKGFNKFIKDLKGVEFSSDDMFGGSYRDLTIDNKIVRFVLLNSSWSCTEDNQTNLLIGRWQLERIRLKLRELPKPFMTFALSHHPLESFTNEEKDMLKSFLHKLDPPTNVFLHGHIHTGVIESISTPDWSIHNLVSGLGYPEKEKRKSGETKVSNCRYAIYRFDFKKNIIEVWIRITRDGGSFVADTQLYEAGGDKGYFTIPLGISTGSFVINEFSLVEVDPIPLVSEDWWVGREIEIKKIMKPQYKAVAITGMGGQGKTALSAEILHRCSLNQYNFDVGVWVDFKEFSNSLHLKMIQLLEKISDGVESVSLYSEENFDDTTKRFLKHLKSKSILLVFDNIDAYICEEKETPIEGMNLIFDMILENAHKSLVLFTTRKPINDNRGSFYHLPLDGLTPDEGVEFFKKRSVELTGHNNEIYSKKLIELIKGHPWWLGLIAGQINSKLDTAKTCVEKFKEGEMTAPGRIKLYFSSIWDQLERQQQNILRYLVEAPRPLSEEEIIIILQNEIGPKKTRQLIRRIERLGCLVKHEKMDVHSKSYQVHPLIREYVHENFEPSLQQRFTKSILQLFLHEDTINFLFITRKSDKLPEVSIANLLDSIETCVNSRNYYEALMLLEIYCEKILSERYQHRILSLSCRVLDALNWKEACILKRNVGISFLYAIIFKLKQLQQNERCYAYLKRFEILRYTSTSSNFWYLIISANISWLDKIYDKSLELLDQSEVLIDEVQNDVEYSACLHIRALVLRDSGKDTDKALKIFKDPKLKILESKRLGNLAKCLINLEHYPDAEVLLRKSLHLLKDENIYDRMFDTGYAYQWISECKYLQNDIGGAKAFLILTRKVWAENAPGLLSQLDELEQKLFGKNIDIKEGINLEEAYAIEKQFLSS